MIIFILIISSIIFMWISFDAIFNGLDLGKKSSWFYGFVSFLCGFVSARAIASYLNYSILNNDLIVGGLFGFITVMGGVVSRYHQLRFDPRSAKNKDDRFKVLYLRYKKEKNPTFLHILQKKY